MASWTLGELQEKATMLVREFPEDFGNRFGVSVHGDDLHRLGPEPTEDFESFTDRMLAHCVKHRADAVIVAWQWPKRPYVTALLACPREGVTTAAIYPDPQKVN
jgi:hypothetical protein